MKKISVTKSVTESIEFEKFDEFVYVRITGWSDPFLVRRDFFDALERKDPSYKLVIRKLSGLNWKDVYHAFSKDFLLKNYFKGNRWQPNYETYVVDALPLLRKGLAAGRIFQDHCSDDGFLYFDGKPVLRPELVEFHSKEYDLEAVKKSLEKHAKVSDIRIYETEWFSVDSYGRHTLECLYTPDPREFRRWQTLRGEFWSCECRWEAQRSLEKELKLERFKRPCQVEV